jgi:hypothetical protein
MTNYWGGGRVHAIDTGGHDDSKNIDNFRFHLNLLFFDYLAHHFKSGFGFRVSGFRIDRCCVLPETCPSLRPWSLLLVSPPALPRTMDH